MVDSVASVVRSTQVVATRLLMQHLPIPAHTSREQSRRSP
jgi:hypothetical protein